MSEIIGGLISYICQLAIILFVLKEFGIVSSPWAKVPAAEPATEGGGNSGGGFDINGMMSGLMSTLQQGQKASGKKKQKRQTPEEPAIEAVPQAAVLEVE